MDKITKYYDASDMKLDEGSRTVISIINTAVIDRDGEVVQPSGLKKKNYSGNPVVMVNHDYQQLPVGKSLWVKYGVDDGGNDAILAKTYISDKTQVSRDVWGLMQDKVLNAFSVGFLALRKSPPSTKEINARPDLKQCKTIIREWEMFEYSVVGIPCNPEALTLAISKGYSQPTIDFLQAGNNAEAVKEIVTATVVEMKQEERKEISQKELQKLLAKKLEEITIAIDPAKVMAKAMHQLRSIAA